MVSERGKSLLTYSLSDKTEVLTVFQLFVCLLVAVAFVSSSAAWAQGGSGFPGVGKQKDWKNANFHFNEGLKFSERKDYNQAAEEYQKAIKGYPYDTVFYKNLGTTYSLLGQYDNAIKIFKAAIDVSKKDNDWEMYKNLGIVYNQQGKYTEAKTALNQCLALKPPASEVTGLKDAVKQAEKMEKVKSAQK